MKITLFDPYLGKFTDGMIKWWGAAGHEVQYQRYYNPELVKWADLVWFFTCDNNLRCATNPPDSPDFEGYDIHHMDLTGKQIVVAPVDIEVWQGHQDASYWDKVDDIVFMADHIRNIIDINALPKVNPDVRVHTIPFSIDLDNWTFKERGHGYNIAVVSERWISKGTDLILQIAYKLKEIDERYKIHWLGQRSGDVWDLAYLDDNIERLGNIEVTNILNDGRSVDQFLEDKNYLLHCSHKEAFSAATAEAMAKGIKPVLHRFYGADTIWPNMTWQMIDEAVAQITGGEYDSKKYRQYLLDRGYDLPSMMARIDKQVIRKES